MNLTPETHWIEALRNQQLGWPRALGELIDNSIDASAANITILAERQTLTISDDGIGCSDVEGMFRQGAHRPHAGKGLGRYGVGLKDTAIWLFGTTSVDTVRNGFRYTVDVNWEKLRDSKIWQSKDPLKEPARDSPPGTTIVFSRVEHDFPSGKNFDRLFSDLTFLFSPALKRGIRIMIRNGKASPVELKRIASPEFEKTIEGDIDVDGRGAHVCVGVVKEGIENPRAGIHYTYKHRVIIAGSGLGCGDTSISRIFGWVSLSDEWHLSKNKDDISKHKDALAEAVFSFIKPVLHLAENQADSIQLKGLEKAVSEMLRAAMSGPPKEKEKRGNGDSHGTATPKNSNRSRGANKRQQGNKFPAQIDAGKLLVEFDLAMDPELIGYVDPHSNRVRLAGRHAYVARLRREDDRPAIFQLAMSLLVHQCVIDPESGQRLLPSFREAEEGRLFSTLLARFLSQIVDIDARNPRIHLVA